MGSIKTLKHPLGTIYEKYDSYGKLINRVGVIGFHKVYQGKTYFVLTDLEGNRIKAANEYLNVIIGDELFKKRELAYSALKVFYSYILVFDLKEYKNGIKDRKNLNRLLGFLEGGFQKGLNWDIDFNISRSNVTINNYLNVYRDFYSSIFLIKDSLLHETRTYAKYSGGGMLGHANKKSLDRFKYNKIIANDNYHIPKYIKPDQYNEIKNLIEKSYTERELLIVTLMYEYGLRIGEVLGITLEDIKEHSGNTYIILRNRLSDKPFQSAKSVINVKNISNYYSNSYAVKDIGFNNIPIDEATNDILQEYLDTTFDEFLLNKSLKKRNNLQTFAKADIVEKGSILKDNYYIFLNKQNYTPLTQSGWNYVCRKIFKEIGIILDKGYKANNLSHRFRHGFAMLRVKEGWSELKLSQSLRHKNIDNVKKYYNPDEDEIFKLLRNQRKYFESKGTSNDN